MHERRFLSTTLILLILIGAPAVYSVVKDPLESSRATVSPSKNSTQKREIASSVPQPSKNRNAVKTKSVILELPCLNSKKAITVDGNLVRLKGGSCLAQSWEDASVSNTSNGVTGAVIFLKGRRFTTDFLELREGDNEIEFSGLDGKGKRTRHKWTVHRRAPAAEDETQKN